MEGRMSMISDKRRAVSKTLKMKCISLLILIVTVSAVCAACLKKPALSLPFSSEDVKEVELYRYSVPADAKKKVAASEDEIKAITDIITNAAVKENRLDPVAGSDVTSFRFHLTDGTDFEIIYISHGVKKGELKSSQLFDFQTSSDIGAVWNHYGGEPEHAPEDVLPVYEESILK